MAYDPRLVTQAEADLLRNIADNIVEPQVVQRMFPGGDPSNPALINPLEVVDNPPPDGSTQTVETPKTEASVDNPSAATTPVTTAEPVTPTSQPDIDWESYRGKNGLILDKYKNKEEAIKGVRFAVMMAKDALTSKAQVEEENLRLRNELINRQTQPLTMAPPIGPPVELPTSSLKLDEVLSNIVREGGTIDEKDISALRDSISEYARNVAKNEVEGALKNRDDKLTKEQKTWQDVDSYMRQNHPDSLNFTDELSVFVQTNPLISKAINALIATGNQREAAELAWIEFDSARNATIQANKTVAEQVKEIQLDASDKVRQEAVDTARKDAGVFTTVAGGVHESVRTGPSQEEVEAAAARMRNTGMGEEWRRHTIIKDLDNDPLSKSVFGP